MGDVSGVSSLINLTSLAVNGSTSVTGSLEEFVENQCRNRESGRLRFIPSGYITFNDGRNPYSYINYSSTGATVEDFSSGNLLGTYVKATDTWTYA